MKLKKLLLNFPHLQVKGPKDVLITGISSNSKCVVPGNLFIAKKGLTHNATHFVPEAIAAGAVAIVTDFYDPLISEIAQIVHSHPADIEADLAAAFYQYPNIKLFTVGITGTNGKTTTSYLIKHLLDSLNEPCGLIGTVEWILGSHVMPSTHTTPDVLTNQKLFHEMCAHGLKAVAMEVSSHALVQERVRGIEFDVAVFTNLTHDHLDYHKTMEHYADAKAQLFASLGKSSPKKHFPKIVVINSDSTASVRMMRDCTVPAITYGVDRTADLMARDIHLTNTGIQCTLTYKGEIASLHTVLIGRFNLYNCLAAAGVGLARGFSLQQIAKSLSAFRSVRGRLERVENPYNRHVYVDYAHTDDALENVLKTLREITKGKLITVFGCGGNRDPTKRCKMAAVAERLSDETVVTSDNPRNEDPEAILKEILSGFSTHFRPHVFLDRKDAISYALRLAHPEDIVLIAGKGHEMYQIFAHKTIDFDDRKVALEALEKMEQRSRNDL
jgi:UDP-N-acetylmuramoyl-L-alanyl-D-glutamate--2,6-diaminopimelate ligase